MALPDLAPEVPSRWVQIDALRLSEDAYLDGESILFELVGDVHAAKAKKIIVGSAICAAIVDGQAQVRLPTYDETMVPSDWAIRVTKSWAPHYYDIRVPPGSGPINLAEIPEVQGVSSASQLYAFTGGIGLIVTTSGYAEGASGSATIANGMPMFRLQIPAGAPGLGNAALEKQANGNWKVVTKTAKSAKQWAAEAMGFYLEPGPPTDETTRDGLPVYFMGGNA